MIMKIVNNRLIKLISITFIFYIGFMALYTHSHNGFVSYLEVGKFILPLLSLLFLGLIGDQRKLSLLKVGILFFSIHFFISLFFYSFTNPSDGRLHSILLGRGANEFAFAIAFMMMLIHNKYLLPRVMYQCMRVRWLRYLAYIILAVLLFKTQSRSGIILIGTYYLATNMSNILRLGYKKVTIGTLLVWMLGLIIFSILAYIVTNNINLESFLSGRYDIWEKNIVYFRSFSVDELILGSDFTNKIIDLEDLRFLSDSHSLYLDFFKYFGLFGVLTLLGALILNLKNNQISKSIFFAFLMTSLVVTTFRYPYVFYVNLLMFAMISIRWDLIKKNYTNA